MSCSESGGKRNTSVFIAHAKDCTRTPYWEKEEEMEKLRAEAKPLTRKKEGLEAWF